MAQDISSQILKGILQGIMLMILDKKPEYGYGLSKQMNIYGLENLPKGTIYPLLATMERRGLIEGRRQASVEGPNRKYYFITERGQKAKTDFIHEWNKLQVTVSKLINEERI
ncbi:PadR family transcriptional regulator [Liquorilactobacillus capillatus]|nr:PadR family transcriptional regulator [Liquorilactobacillus capillatus]